jgi:hypothetical protein
MGAVNSASLDQLFASPPVGAFAFRLTTYCVGLTARFATTIGKEMRISERRNRQQSANSCRSARAEIARLFNR